MKRARDIRDQLEGLMERVEIEICSNASDLDAIKKAITSGMSLLGILQCFLTIQ
jgi:pre-mRNA-splicing factor ATP-dependent RNA helicase DHX16